MCVLYLDLGEQSGWELAGGPAAKERKERMRVQQPVNLGLCWLCLCFCFCSARAQAGCQAAGGPRRLGRSLVLSFPPP